MLPRMPYPRYAAEGLAQHAGQAGLDDITETKGEGMRYTLSQETKGKGDEVPTLRKQSEKGMRYPLPQETKEMRYPLSQEIKGQGGEVPTVSGNKGRRV